MQFKIRPTGSVTGIAIKASTLGHKPTEACIKSAVRRWRFPKPEPSGEVRVLYPFHFKP